MLLKLVWSPREEDHQLGGTFPDVCSWWGLGSADFGERLRICPNRENHPAGLQMLFLKPMRGVPDELVHHQWSHGIACAYKNAYKERQP